MCAETLEHLSNALLTLKKEGWKLNEVLHGNVRMSRAVDRGGDLVNSAPGQPLTTALAFGVLPEIRIASRRASHAEDRLKVRPNVPRRSVLCMKGPDLVLSTSSS